MGIYRIGTEEIMEALDTALDNLEGDFSDKQLQIALERAKLYPFVCDKAKSVPKYTKKKFELLKKEKREQTKTESLVQGDENGK